MTLHAPKSFTPAPPYRKLARNLSKLTDALYLMSHPKERLCKPCVKETTNVVPQKGTIKNRGLWDYRQIGKVTHKGTTGNAGTFFSACDKFVEGDDY